MFEYEVAHGEASTEKFLSRLGERLDLEGKSVLDVGCGIGALCVEALRRDALRAVGVDTRLEFGRRYVERFQAELGSRIQLVATAGDLSELGDERFDVVCSKDCMEHYADPESFVPVMTRHLKPGGEFVVGFGSPWKSPYGGHLDYMTKLPWSHLLFPESVIMAERRRFRPNENATRYEEIAGGLNKMTLRRFRSIMAASDLRCEFMATNVSEHPAVKAMGIVSRVPGLTEYFTLNVYGIWRSPA